MRSPTYDDGTFKDIKLWLITHMHADHCDSFGIKKIDKDIPVVFHPNYTDSFKGYNQNPLSWGQSKKFLFDDCAVTIIAVPAYHGNNLLMRKLAGAVNGYIVEIQNQESTFTIYFTSDTVYHKDVVDFLTAAYPKIDLTVANLGEVSNNKFGGPLTMSAPMLDKYRQTLNLGLVIPVHIDDMSHYQTNPSDLKKFGFEILPVGQWHTVYSV
jgi:L-ascorbate metabolism protein UlaG (beta-lactamase superfamily)